MLRHTLPEPPAANLANILNHLVRADLGVLADRPRFCRHSGLWLVTSKRLLGTGESSGHARKSNLAFITL
jgi:hypothetical protein